MANDETHEEGARGRRWKVSISLVIGGAVVLVYGLATRYWPAIAAGVVVVLFFGAIAAGAREAEAGAGPVHAKTGFNVPPPAPTGVKRVYLPRGWSKRKP